MQALARHLSRRAVSRLAALANGPPGLLEPAAERLACGEGSAAAAAASSLQLGWRWEQAALMSKQKGGKKGGGMAPHHHASPAGHFVPGEGPAGFSLEPTKQLMNKALQHLQHELANIRTGRATPGMLDHLKVEVYGERMPLRSVGTAVVRDPQLLAISVFDPTTAEPLAKAIRDSPLQLNPRVEGQEVLVPIPRPTAETLQAMMKVCKAEAEQAKVSVRHARKAAMDDVKKRAVSEDERHRVEKEVQRLTDDFIATIDQHVRDKERSITLHTS